MVDTQIACLTDEVLPALKKKGLNLVDYEELHLHEKDQVLSRLFLELLVIRLNPLPTILKLGTYRLSLH